ncbi:glycoside hydrolase family 104 protein [Piscinibacter sp.]|uniref:glycoside hydrolase family 24 protein n=1 Tax=Piscinibacter sp. TaxID=1903157 RepID=UPI0039E325D3
MKHATAIVLGFGVLALTASYAAKRAADAVATSDDADGSTALDYVNVWGLIEQGVDTYSTEQAMRTNANLPAFLDAIMWSEGTAREADPYRVCYGYRHTIVSLADHPAVTGEWKGEDISKLGPQYVGKVSTAAGAFQIIRATWLGAKRALGLADFSAESQRAAATWLIKRRGALDDIERGDLQAAVDKCAAEWASLPGSTSGQPQRKFDQFADAYSSAGGWLA